MSPPLRICLSAAICLLPQLAAAEPLSPAPGVSGPVGPAPERGARVHDGFYLRVASGFGVLDERLESGELAGGGTLRARSRGVTTVSDLAFGGTVAPGWVVGGGIYSADLIASTLRISGAGTTPLPEELDPALRSLSLIGPFVDWYPNPRGGFHAQAALGLTTLTARVFGHGATERSEYLGLGGGLLIGTGYDWWVAAEWSIGVLTQLGVRVLRGEDDDGVSWTHVMTTSPTLSISLTYH